MDNAGHGKHMNPIAEFESKLVALIGQPSSLRPFVCDGSPLECRAFIVGFNPATSMSGDFWQFWSPDHGFNKGAWFESYKQERQLRPLKPGKTRRNPISNTRRVIAWVLEEANPIRCLETNIYAAATEKAVDLNANNRITAPFDFLLEQIQPRIVVVHGKDANFHLGSKQLTCRVISVRHFSRGWSQESARELGQLIRNVCNA